MPVQSESVLHENIRLELADKPKKQSVVISSKHKSNSSGSYGFKAIILAKRIKGM